MRLTQISRRIIFLCFSVCICLSLSACQSKFDKAIYAQHGHILKNQPVDVSEAVEKFIPIGMPYADAETLLRDQGFQITVTPEHMLQPAVLIASKNEQTLVTDGYCEIALYFQDGKISQVIAHLSLRDNVLP